MVRVVAGSLAWDRVTEARGENLMTEDAATSVKCLGGARRMVGRKELNLVSCI